MLSSARSGSCSVCKSCFAEEVWEMRQLCPVSVVGLCTESCTWTPGWWEDQGNNMWHQQAPLALWGCCTSPGVKHLLPTAHGSRKAAIIKSGGAERSHHINSLQHSLTLVARGSGTFRLKSLPFPLCLWKSAVPEALYWTSRGNGTVWKLDNSCFAAVSSVVCYPR